MSRKLSYEEVSKVFEDAGCKLLETEYKNGKTKMQYCCSCGNISYINYDNFKQGCRCMICGCIKMKAKQKLSYEYVSNYFISNNCILLAKEYINNRTKMQYICSCGNIDYINFSHFKQGHRCKICKYEKIKEANKLSYGEVKKIFSDNGCILLSTEYINAHKKLLFQCSCGNITYITYRDFSRGSRCMNCMPNKVAEKLKLSFEDVYDKFKQNGYELLETQYTNAHIKLKYKCPEGHIDSMEYASFYSGCRCPVCSLKNRSGENHYLWNPELTDEEREYGRLIPGYNEWRLEVYKRDNFTCQICGYKGRKLRAHHLDGYHWCKDKRVDIDNGITICEDCHDINKNDSFHNIYGTWDNTREQFNEFLLFKNNQINI